MEERTVLRDYLFTITGARGFNSGAGSIVITDPSVGETVIATLLLLGCIYSANKRTILVPERLGREEVAVITYNGVRVHQLYEEQQNVQ